MLYGTNENLPDAFEVEYQRNILEKENIKIHKELNEMIITDPLTGLFNRRHFHKISEDILKETQKNTTCATLSYLDIDDFKKINDSHGHDKGDKVLQYLSQILSNNAVKDKIMFLELEGKSLRLLVSIHHKMKQ